MAKKRRRHKQKFVGHKHYKSFKQKGEIHVQSYVGSKSKVRRADRVPQLAMELFNGLYYCVGEQKQNGLLSED